MHRATDSRDDDPVWVPETDRQTGRRTGGAGSRPGWHYLSTHAVDSVQESDDEAVEVPQVQHQDPERHKPT